MFHTLTFNPAMDKVLRIGSLVHGITNRTGNTSYTIGGKGTHVSITLSLLGAQNCAFGFAYGPVGRQVIDELKANNVETDYYYSEADSRNTRTNYVIVEEDKHLNTTISEKGVTPTPEEYRALIRSIRSRVSPDDCMILAGDASNMHDTDIYSRVIDDLQGLGLRFVIDASGPYLKNALSKSLYMIKPNEDELAQLCGFDVSDDAGVLKGISFLDRYSIPVIAVSLGSRGSIVKAGGSVYKAVPPKVPVVNTNGCGDSFLSALLVALDQKKDIPEALDLATAVSAATAAHPLTVGFDAAFMQSLIGKTIIKKL